MPANLTRILHGLQGVLNLDITRGCLESRTGPCNLAKGSRLALPRHKKGLNKEQLRVTNGSGVDSIWLTCLQEEAPGP
jgi:hypothetical protein